MGAPKKNRQKFEKPKERWNLERIKHDRAIAEEYGLKNMKELWKVQSELSRIRGNARMLLAGGSPSFEEMKKNMIGRLSKYGITSASATLDDLLDLKENALLERRLQTVVFRKGLAKSIKQARQLTVHGFVAIDGKKVNRPGYLVSVLQEGQIGYYKRIDIHPAKPPAPEAEAQVAAAPEQPAEAEPAKPEEKTEAKEQAATETTK